MQFSSEQFAHSSDPASAAHGSRHKAVEHAVIEP
jgi:hypothetical protein